MGISLTPRVKTRTNLISISALVVKDQEKVFSFRESFFLEFLNIIAGGYDFYGSLPGFVAT